MSISGWPSIQMAHTAVMVTRIKGGGSPPPEDPKEPNFLVRFFRWLFKG